jgi:hypothetical protein
MNFPFVNLIDLAEKMLQFSGIFEQPFDCFLEFLPCFFHNNAAATGGLF